MVRLVLGDTRKTLKSFANKAHAYVVTETKYTEQAIFHKLLSFCLAKNICFSAYIEMPKVCMGPMNLRNVQGVH